MPDMELKENNTDTYVMEETLPTGTDAETESNSADSTADQIKNAAYEEIAEKLGWMPKEKFHGRKDDWEDARTFIERKRFVPKSLNTVLVKQIEELNRKIDTLNSRQFESDASSQKTKLQKLEAEWDQAIEEADKDRAKALSREINHLQTSIARQEEERKTNSPSLSPELLTWLEDNEWADGRSRKFDPIRYSIAELIFRECEKDGLPFEEAAKALEEDERMLGYLDRINRSAAKPGGNGNGGSPSRRRNNDVGSGRNQPSGGGKNMETITFNQFTPEEQYNIDQIIANTGYKEKDEKGNPLSMARRRQLYVNHIAELSTEKE